MNRGHLSGRSYGEIINRYEDAGLILSESIYPPDTKIARHSHGHPYFCILLQGAYTETYGGQSRVCKPSTVIFHPVGEQHSNQFLSKGGHLFRVEIKRQLLERISQCSTALSEPADFTGGLPARLASKLYQEFRQPDEVSSLVIEGLTLEMAAEVARRRRQGIPVRVAPPWLKRARELIHAQFSESLELADIAKPVGVHPLHLARVFRRFHGCTVGEYIRRLRVDYAAHQLSTSDSPLAVVAVAAGFTDQSHFSKAFKLLTGMTPSRYRAIFRPPQSDTTKFR